MAARLAERCGWTPKEICQLTLLQIQRLSAEFTKLDEQRLDPNLR